MAMTAHAVASEKQKCFDAGMDGYISKPFEPDDLKKKILLLTKASDKTLKKKGSKPKGKSRPKTTKVFDTHHDSSPQHVPAERTEHVMTSSGKINLSYLKTISEGNDAFVIEMIEMFLNKTPQALEEMNECFKNQNWEELRQIAHKIKPSYAYIGLKDMQATLSIIETWNDTEDELQLVTDMMKKVETGTQNAFKQLRDELSGMK
jgi:HPt (histidine-containing phosphotransfer) domain-containing protein